MAKLRLESIERIGSLALGCWRLDGRMFLGNDALAKLLKCSPIDLDQGRINWIDMTPPDYVELDRIAIREVQACGECRPYQKEFIRSDGTRVRVLLGGATFGKGILDAGCFFAVDLSAHREPIVSAAELDFRSKQLIAGDAQERIGRLTAREYEIAELLAAGQTCKQIARTLGISQKTVDNHRAAILRKVDVDNATQLAHHLRFVLKTSSQPRQIRGKGKQAW